MQVTIKHRSRVSSYRIRNPWLVPVWTSIVTRGAFVFQNNFFINPCTINACYQVSPDPGKLGPDPQLLISTFMNFQRNKRFICQNYFFIYPWTINASYHESPDPGKHQPDPQPWISTCRNFQSNKRSFVFLNSLFYLPMYNKCKLP